MKVRLRTGVGYVRDKKTGRILYKFDNVEVIEVGSRNEES